MYFYYLILAVLILLPTGISAAEIEELKEIKVTTARDILTAENIPGSLTVFTEKEIKKKQHQTLEDMLRGELGMDVVQSGSNGAQTSIFMRAAGSTSTLMIIDGVETNLATTGAFDFGDLTLDNIERVEILRGPQSIQWGANAAGGVINVTTKKGKGKPTHSLSIEAGSYKTFRESLRSSGSINKFDYSVSASLLTSQGFSTLNKRSGGGEDDGTVNKTLSTRLGYDFNPDTCLEFISRYTKSQDETDNINGEGSGTDVEGYFNNIDDILISMPFRKSFGSWWNLKLTPSFTYNRALTVSDAENDGILNRTYTLEMQNNIELNRHFSVLFGGEYQNKQGFNIGGSGGAEGYAKWNDNEALFLQGIYELPGHLALTAGFRQDWNTHWDETTTEKFEASYQFPETSTKLHAAYATGFRAPTFNDLYAPPIAGWTKTSNENLIPEEIASTEVGIKQNFMDERVKLGVTFFYSEIKNFIQSHGSTFITTNFGEFHSQGLETSIDLDLPPGYSLSIHHTWNDHYLFEKTKSTHYQPGTRRPKHKLNANLSHRWNNGVESVVGLFIRGRAKGWNADNETPAFGTLRTALSYQYDKNIKLTSRLENILDARALEVGGFGYPGRSGYVGFVYTFN